MYNIVKLSGIIAIGIVLSSGLTGCGMLSADKAETDAEILMGQDGQTLWESSLPMKSSWSITRSANSKTRSTTI